MMPGISYLTVIRHIMSQGGIDDLHGSEITPSFHRPRSQTVNYQRAFVVLILQRQNHEEIPKSNSSY